MTDDVHFPPLLQFMLVENATLLLAASDFLSEASWDSMTLPTTVLCSFILSESLSLSALALFWRTFVSDVLMFKNRLVSKCLIVSVVSA